ncbi:putative TIM-barrel fold metal-dependent hydrolase [Catenulispora sp. EB89]|uniref:amidohydrolase family protein n=1 Tax=Catenulispora sp. EB89 TaxID=3156257 RepID=UPI0035125D8C
MNPNGLIDVHAHFTTDDYVSTAKNNGLRDPDGMPEAYWPRWDAETHLRLMDEVGIARAILSISSPGVHFGHDEAARALARDVNEAGAEIAHAHPDRFGHFASLPLPDLDGALAEIAHAFDDLHADGVILMTNSAGLYLGDERMRPVLAELDRRGAVAFLHPTSCVGHEALALGYPRPMIEFLFDTARTVVDLILSGTPQRFPDIQFVVPHAGGVLPLLADRLELFRTISGDTDGPTVADALADFYYDLAGTPADRQMKALISIAEPDRLLYGSDYAWTRYEQALRAIEALDALPPLNGQDWRRLTTRNALRLFAPDRIGSRRIRSDR